VVVTRWLLVLAACGGSAKPRPAPRPLTAEQWVRGCAEHIEVARLVIARIDPLFLDLQLEPSSAAFNPSVRFRVKTANDVALYEGNVERGRFPCIDFDTDDPAYNNMAWLDRESKITSVSRLRRMDGDEAWFTALAAAPKPTVAVFAREFQRALEACLVDGRGVKLEDPPKDFSCADTVDKCPDTPDGFADPSDGCPEPAKPPDPP
jgi:hypothetical protein